MVIKYLYKQEADDAFMACYNLLPAEIRELAITNFKNFWKNSVGLGPCFAPMTVGRSIKGGFILSDTPEGYTYWEDIMAKYGSLRPMKEPKLPEGGPIQNDADTFV